MDLDDLKRKKRIAKRARRDAMGEAKLILSAGFSLLAIILFTSAGAYLQYVAIYLGLSFFVVWIGVSFAIAAVWAVIHFLWVRPRIAEAQRLDAAALHSYEASASLSHEDDK